MRRHSEKQQKFQAKKDRERQFRKPKQKREDRQDFRFVEDNRESMFPPPPIG